METLTFTGFQRNRTKVAKFKFGNHSWVLPGGHILKTENLDAAASRILKKRTGLEHIYLEQFRVFGDKNRIVESPHSALMKSELKAYDAQRFTPEVVEWLTSRFVCIGYYALVDIRKVTPQNGEFDDYLEWRSIKEIPQMIHDHNAILDAALEALRQNLDKKLIGFNLLPETFTMRELQALYEAVYSRPFAMNNFQKKILDLHVLERLEKKFTGAQHKAPYLYRFKQG